MKINVAVLFGGKSVEHEVSVISALQAMNRLDKTKYELYPVYLTKKSEFYTGDALREIRNFTDVTALLKKCQKVTMIQRDGETLLVRLAKKWWQPEVIARIDVAFPIVHGTNVEDGALQGFLTTVGVPFVGCDVLSSALGMDKFASKTLLQAGGFPVLSAQRYSTDDYQELKTLVAKIEAAFPYPVIVKPVNLGSSVGISRADNQKELLDALEEAFGFAKNILVEPAVTALREINCSVLGDGHQAEASECEEPFAAKEILTYQDKYIDQATGGSKGMASLKRKIPADIPATLRKKIRESAVAAFQYLGCNGVSRVDFLLDKKTNQFWINEFNTIPGSLSFYLWEPIGVKYPELLDRLIQLALKRQRENESVIYSFDTNILASGSFGGKNGGKFWAKGGKF